MKVELGVNVDHVATLRQARGTRYPSVVQAALLAEQAGASAITIHLREDRRHIQDDDVYVLKSAIQTKMNLEMALSDDVIAVALQVIPEAVCFVPEKRDEQTTEGGLDIIERFDRVQEVAQLLAKKGTHISMFVEPDRRQIEAAKEAGAHVVELHTGGYALAPSAAHLDELVDAARFADSIGLIVHAGHGLDYHNVSPIAALPHLAALNIGHSIVARAVMTGMEAAVKDMLVHMRDAL